jgi:hypothetical protein
MFNSTCSCCNESRPELMVHRGQWWCLDCVDWDEDHDEADYAQWCEDESRRDDAREGFGD